MSTIEAEAILLALVILAPTMLLSYRYTRELNRKLIEAERSRDSRRDALDDECKAHGATMRRMAQMTADRLIPTHEGWEPMTDRAVCVHIVYLLDAPDSSDGWLAVLRDGEEAERYAEWLRSVPRPDEGESYTQDVCVDAGYLTYPDSVLFWNDGVADPDYSGGGTDWTARAFDAKRKRDAS